MMIRRTALVPVLSLSVASARTLACDWACDPAPSPASAGCHDQGEMTAVASMSGTHACAHDGATLTALAVKPVSDERLAVTLILDHTPVSPASARRTTDRLAASPPSPLAGGASRSLSILRI